MTLDRKIVKEVPFPVRMSKDYLEQLLDTLPPIKKHNTKKPEWPPTPIYEIDLAPFGYKRSGQKDNIVYVKDESDTRSNPTGTVKDRKAHELGPVFYRIFGENLYNQDANGGLSRIITPRLCEITAGNAGLAEAIMNEKYGLPPPKLLLNVNTPKERLEALKNLRADIYLAPLDVNIFTGRKEPYTPEQIKVLTNNAGGIDVTSSKIITRHRDYYDWHWHEIFNFLPDEVYGPYGSGEWFDNGLTWQIETAKNSKGRKDSRLSVDPDKVKEISILAAEPQRIVRSEADKLVGKKPYIYYGKRDVNDAKKGRFTPGNTGVYRVPEEKIKLAYDIMTLSGSKTEPSAAIGLGLYLQRYEQGKIDKGKKVLIINTGKGI